jgi:dihydroorotate dehydrogenase (NAD+) catalytic subunit
MFKYDLSLDPPLMNAAGSLGFKPDSHGPVDLKRFGAFVTNPISLAPRTPAQERACLAYPGGFLLHTGYPNPGIRAVLRRCARQWERSPVPVIVHILAQRGEEVFEIARRLESLENLAALELGIPPEASAELAAALVAAGLSERPVIARLPLERAENLASGVLEAGAAVISLGAPRGALPGSSGRLIQGRLYGPAVFPLALETLQRILRLGSPVIAAGGVYTPQQAQTMLRAGALAVQLDAVLWRGGFGDVE